VVLAGILCVLCRPHHGFNARPSPYILAKRRFESTWNHETKERQTERAKQTQISGAKRQNLKKGVQARPFSNAAEKGDTQREYLLERKGEKRKMLQDARKSWENSV
jgi:hypothetical protein